MIHSIPRLIQWEEIHNKGINTCICKCPLPIQLPDGKGYAHIVRPNINYVCSECKTVMRLVEGDT